MSEEQLILQASIYGGLSILLIIAMIWMVIKEKKNYDKSNGKRK